MTNKCRYAQKKKNLLKGYCWCSHKRKVIKGNGTNCYCWGFKYRFPKNLFVWIKELIIYGR